jgi:hypothetical protein
MNKICFVFLLAGMTIWGGSLHFAKAGEPQIPVPTKWEYKAISHTEVARLAPKASKNPLTDGLNVLGADGWELVGVQTQVGSNLSNPMAVSSSSTFLFKRPKAKS